MKLTFLNFVKSRCQQRSSVGTSYYCLLPLQEEQPLHSHSAMKEPGVWTTVKKKKKLCGWSIRVNGREQKAVRVERQVERPLFHKGLVALLKEMKTQAKIFCQLKQGSPTPGLWTRRGPQPVRNPAAQPAVSGGRANKASSAAPRHSHCHLNHHTPHPTPPPPPSVEKLSSTKPAPGAKKVGDR